MEKIFILGQTRVQGLEYKEAYETMVIWESRLKEIGYEVVNPMKLYSEHTTEVQARKEMLAGLMECNAILMLSECLRRDWESLLFQIANLLRYRMYSENDLPHLQNYSKQLRDVTPLVDIPEESTDDINRST